MYWVTLFYPRFYVLSKRQNIRVKSRVRLVASLRGYITFTYNYRCKQTINKKHMGKGKIKKRIMRQGGYASWWAFPSLIFFFFFSKVCVHVTIISILHIIEVYYQRKESSNFFQTPFFFFFFLFFLRSFLFNCVSSRKKKKKISQNISN